MEGFYAGDQIRFSLIAQDRYGNPINLTGATVKFRFQCEGKPAQTRDAVIVDAINPLGGMAEYWTVSSDFTPGTIWWEWLVADSLTHESTGPFPRRSGMVVARLIPLA